jgi:hypothetical protein
MVDVTKIKQLLKKHFKTDGAARIDPDTGVVDVEGHVTLKFSVNELPCSFGDVSGSFICHGGRLQLLTGAPHHVGGHFLCYSNKLTSLQGAPRHVGGEFICAYNKLTSLVGAPPHVGSLFICNENKLTSLEGAPLHVGGDFWCNSNPLESLEGAPHHVGGYFHVDYQKHLPLLRLLSYTGGIDWNKQLPAQVGLILNKYMGEGKPGAIKAAAELIRAGYPENAKW